MSTPEKPLLDRDAVQRAFEKAATTYAEASVFQVEVADRLFERLNWIKLSPSVVLDLGASVGHTTQRLKTHYPQAEVHAVELAPTLLKQGSGSRCCSDLHQLPFASESVDLVFSNLSLHWSVDPVAMLDECQRVLRPGGLLFFTTLGVDTLKELYESFLSVDHHAHVHPFGDMHDIGDLLLHARWENPVMDRELLTLHYASLSDLFRDLKETGTQNALADRPKHLSGKKAWQKMSDYYASHYQEDGAFPATMELIYGHAWRATKQQKLNDLGEVSVPISSITVRD